LLGAEVGDDLRCCAIVPVANINTGGD